MTTLSFIKRSIIVLCVLLVPIVAAAQEAITRRDGFRMMWSGVVRLPQPTRESPFSDVIEGSDGAADITFAKSRGILDAAETFRPDDSLQLVEALVWLFRTRNIADPDDIQPSTLSGFIARYPIVYVHDDVLKTMALSEEELTQIIRTFDAMLKEEEHEVSLYAEKFQGKGTAFGEAFDMNAFTAAHKYFPHNTLVRVTNVENGKSVIVRINDRGPYVEGRDMDLSLAAFTAIADRAKGVIRARFERLGDAMAVGACTGTSPQRQRIARGTYLSKGVPRFFKLGETLALTSPQRFVVRGITYPDGSTLTFQDFIFEGEAFTLRPSVEGEFRLLLGSVDGKRKTMGMTVMRCP